MFRHGGEAGRIRSEFAQGFFRTGDQGHQTQGGSIVITGRIKDLINRGGEKISAKEVEDLIVVHPGVLEVAVVAMPHARLGETVCAFVRVRPEASVKSEDILAGLAAAGIAKQKLPEAIVFVDELPKTPAGKVRKDVLRKQARDRVQQAAKAK